MKQWLRFPTKDDSGYESNVYLNLDPDVELWRIEPLLEGGTGGVIPNHSLVFYHTQGSADPENWDTLVASMAPLDLMTLLIKQVTLGNVNVAADEPVKVHIKSAIESDVDLEAMANRVKVMYTTPDQPETAFEYSFRLMASDLFVKWGRRRADAPIDDHLRDTQDMFAKLAAWCITRVCRFCKKGDVPHPGDRYALHGKAMSEDGMSEPPCISSSIWMAISKDDMYAVSSHVVQSRP